MMRGRGGCYKHTFYGIESHRCMETTPSLACANKCVFCWRHHSNPVGTEWKWKMDDAELVLQGALENHYNMIKEFKGETNHVRYVWYTSRFLGVVTSRSLPIALEALNYVTIWTLFVSVGVPGVIPEKFAEAMSAKHCALSLVGEPIMYPQINQFCRLLHDKGISTFLVTNAQFPDAIRAMDPVTQLYVSVDASTKDSLKKIDRPLFKDFWERFIDSLKALSGKVCIIHSWNLARLGFKHHPDNTRRL